MKKAKVQPLPRSKSIAPRRLLPALWGCFAIFVVFFGPDLAREFTIGNEDWEPSEASVLFGNTLEGFSRAIGAGRATAAVATIRDDFYQGFPEAGRVRSESRVASVPAPQVVPPAVAVAEPGAAPGVMDSAASGSGAAAAPELPTEPEPEQEIAQAQFRPTRVLVVGASSIQFELGRELENSFEEFEGVEVMRFGRHSTGLSRADYYDWMDRARELVDEFHPDLVVAQVGGNDCQGITDVDGGVVARWSETETWATAYHARVTEFVEIFADTGAQVIIVGMPIMRSPAFRAKMETLNTVTREAVEATGHWYVSTWEMTSSPDGDFTDEVELDGRTRDFRADDGTHLSLHGAIYVTRQLMELFEARYDLTRAATE
jgi:hypothetical protein